MRIALRPTVAADLAALGLTLPHRLKGLTAFAGDVPVGVGGLVFMPDGAAFATLLVTEEGRRYKAAFLRAALRVLAEARAAKIVRIYAAADPAIAGSAAFLQRLGFKPIARELWLLHQRD